MATRAPTWEVYEIVAELIEQGAHGPPSRNRHFEAWQDQTRGAAYRLYGRLRSIHDELVQLEHDGAHASAVSASEADPVLLTYALQQVPQGPVTRRTELLRPEWELLAALCGDRTPVITLATGAERADDAGPPDAP